MKDVIMRRSVILSALLCCFTLPAMSGLTRSLIINEVMQSVTQGNLDQLNEYPDGWVELYNPTDNAITLTDYALGESNKFSKCYKIPRSGHMESNGWWSWWVEDGDVVIPARGHMIIYCDNEATVTDMEVHTDFRMPNSKGGTLYLFDSNKNLADSLYLPPMPATDVAYGRETDGSSKTGYMLTPTKGASNSGGFAKMILPDPIITPSMISEAKANSGKKMDISISMPQGVPDDAVIRYSLSYSEPTSSSPIYTEGIQIDKTTIVKAAIFAKGCITPPAATRCYIFLGRKLSVPVVSLVTDRKNLYDSDAGIIVNNTSSDDKENWRRPVRIDYFPTGKDVSQLSQGAEIRVSGAYSRANAQKSFIVYANSRFDAGGKDYFEAPFWEYTGSDMTKSPSIGLRSSGNDFNFSQMRDGVSQMLFGMNTDLDWQDFQPAITFINGEYYGILNIRERANEDNIWMHYEDDKGGHLNEITLIENPTWGQDGLKRGDWGQYNEFTSFLSSKSTTLSDYEKSIDVVEFTNLMMANIYMSNTDFPGNNYVMWRPEAAGGKWRFILKDVDRSFGLCYWHGDSSNMDGGSSDAEYLRWILRDPENIFQNNYESNGADQTRLIRYLMKIPSYRDMFADRFTIYLGDFLKSDYIASVIDRTADVMSLEMEYHKMLYGGGMNDWYTEIDRMKTWAKERTESMYAQLKEYFNFDTLIKAKINDNMADYADFNVTVNGIPLATGLFDGKLFAGRTYSISAARKSGGSNDIGWRVVCRNNAGQVISNDIHNGPSFDITPNSSISEITISVIGSITDVNEPISINEPVNIRYYNMHGVESDRPFNGMNIKRSTYSDGTISSEILLIR